MNIVEMPTFIFRRNLEKGFDESFADYKKTYKRDRSAADAMFFMYPRLRHVFRAIHDHVSLEFACYSDQSKPVVWQAWHKAISAGMEPLDFDFLRVAASLEAALRCVVSELAHISVVSPDGDEWTLDCANSFAMWARQHPGNLRIQEACDWDSIHALARLTATVCGDREVEVMRDAQAYR